MIPRGVSPWLGVSLVTFFACRPPSLHTVIPAYANDGGVVVDANRPHPNVPVETVRVPCPLPVENAGMVLARVGDVTITACDVALAWEDRTREGYAVDNPREILGGLVNDALRAATVTVRPHDPAVDRVLADALLRADTLAAMAAEQPDEPAIQHFYDTHREDFSVPERVHLREVVLATQTEAVSVARDLTAGHSFESLVTRTVDATGRRDGGDLGWLSQSDVVSGVPPAVIAAGFALTAVGDVTTVALPGMAEPPGHRHPRRRQVWHVVQLLQRVPAETTPLADARRRIVYRLTRDRYESLRREIRAQWIERLRPSVHDAVDDRALRSVRIAPR